MSFWEDMPVLDADSEAKRRKMIADRRAHRRELEQSDNAMEWMIAAGISLVMLGMIIGAASILLIQSV